MLEKNRRIVAAQRASQEPHGILCIRRHGQAPADSVQPLHFVRLTVPGIAAFEETAGNAHDHRRCKSIHGAPAHGAAVIQLLGRGIGVFAELNLGYRQKSGRGHADSAADDAFFGETGIEHSVHAESFLQPQSRGVHATFAADIFAEDQHARIDREFVLERAAHGGHKIDARSLRLRPRAAFRRHDARATQAALLLQVDGPIGARIRKRRSVEHGRDPEQLAVRRLRSVFSTNARAWAISRSQSAAERACGNQLLAQFAQRITRLFRGDFVAALVGLRVLSRMSGQTRDDEPEQRRAFAGSHARQRRLRSARRRPSDPSHRRRELAARESFPNCGRCCRREFAAAKARKFRSRCPR